MRETEGAGDRPRECYTEGYIVEVWYGTGLKDGRVEGRNRWYSRNRATER